MRHGAVGNVFTVRKSKSLKLWAANYRSRSWLVLRWSWSIALLSHFAVVELLIVLNSAWKNLGYYPTHYSRKQVITHFATIAQVNIFQTLRFVHHV
jgi:hypothetical protein